MIAPRPPMRKRLIRREVPRGVRFITFSCQRRLPLLRNPAIARVFVDRLAVVCEQSGTRLYTYVVMPEHVHLLLAPPEGVALDRVLVSIKHRVSRVVIGRWRELEAPIRAKVTAASGYRFWQKGGGFDRNVRDETEFTKAVRYIHENPVERGLVAQAQQYEFSSVRWWLARHRGEAPARGPGVAPCDDPPGALNWAAWRGFMVWRGEERLARGTITDDEPS